MAAEPIPLLRGVARTPTPIELTVIGQVVGASELHTSNAHCTWQLTSGGSWMPLRGRFHGSSQCDAPADSGAVVFQHPIDAVFQGEELRGWPRLEVELRFLDSHGRSDLVGYGVVHVPTIPGHHVLRCPVWRPRGSFFDRLSAFFLGGYPQLKDTKLQYGVHVDDDQSRLGRTVRDQRFSSSWTGTVHFHVGICVRRLDPQQMQSRDADSADTGTGDTAAGSQAKIASVESFALSDQ
ncbi:hypothetical protein AB1Y20_002289 [Prymnesium parvum]|uniref:B9 domain-containing protein 2 n=1 Tax=Prymnesium parvum TaxID=97485 RepID=A0AB34JBB4_PRYPA